MKNDEELSREFQKEHGKAMGKYDRAYQSTKKEVLDKTHHFARISRKGMLLGIIVFSSFSISSLLLRFQEEVWRK